MFLETWNESLWSVLFLPLYVLCAGSLLLRCRFLPFLRPGLVLQAARKGEDGSGEGMSPFQAASTALAATVGTGNIIGTAQAIAMGGPGALFWMWAASLLGMTVKYAEILLGQRMRGSAAAYIRVALGKLPAHFYGLLLSFSALTVGTMAQLNGCVGALCEACGRHSLSAKALIGLALTAVLALCLAGGVRRVLCFCERLVPAMGLGFLLAAGTALFCTRTRIPGALALVLRDALRPRAAIGAAGGVALRQTLLWGLRRGAFSNEAGLGTAAAIHAGVRSKDAPLHALWGVLEVFLDTILLCTATALVILCSGVPIPYGSMPGPELLRDAFTVSLGRRASDLVICMALTLFGFSTALGSTVVGTQCQEEMWGAGAGRRFRRLMVLCAFPGCVLPVELIWQAADSVNVLLAIPNLLSLLILAPGIQRLTTARFYGGNRRMPLDENGETAIL
jgi:AGCS family alanine or glycine:cation symporter